MFEGELGKCILDVTLVNLTVTTAKMYYVLYSRVHIYMGTFMVESKGLIL